MLSSKEEEKCIIIHALNNRDTNVRNQADVLYQCQDPCVISMLSSTEEEKCIIIHTLNNKDTNVRNQDDVLYQCQDQKMRRNASISKILLLKTIQTLPNLDR